MCMFRNHYSPFTDCTSLSEINVSGENENFRVDDRKLFNKDKTALYLYLSKEERDEYKIHKFIVNKKIFFFFFFSIYINFFKFLNKHYHNQK